MQRVCLTFEVTAKLIWSCLRELKLLTVTLLPDLV